MMQRGRREEREEGGEGKRKKETGMKNNNKNYKYYLHQLNTPSISVCEFLFLVFRRKIRTHIQKGVLNIQKITTNNIENNVEPR